MHVIGFKNTREARRALRDWLPLIGEALSVDIVEIVDFGDKRQTQRHVDDVGRYLASRHVAVTAKTTAEAAGSAHSQLVQLAHEMNADLIVAGGYVTAGSAGGSSAASRKGCPPRVRSVA
jgi:nucleotide-binding universal stress UspA family protein